MKFSIIYEFDCPTDYSVKRFQPPNIKLWNMTERFDNKPSEWCSDLWNGKAKHRKYCAFLTRAQFEKFLNCVYIQPEDVETMGSLGAPGFGYGWVPAICFQNMEDEAIQSAYVTPILEVKGKDYANFPESEMEKDWQRLRKAILAQYR